MKQPENSTPLTPVQKEWSHKIAQEIAKIILKHESEFEVSSSAILTVLITLITGFQKKEDSEMAYKDFTENLARAYEKMRHRFYETT